MRRTPCASASRARGPGGVSRGCWQPPIGARLWGYHGPSRVLRCRSASRPSRLDRTDANRFSVAQALIIVDIQKDYFPGGANPLHEPEQAVAAARRVLDHFRSTGESVLHIQHVWDAPDALFMRPGTEGVEIHGGVAPLPGETVIQKDAPNAFLRTSLERELRERAVDALVVCGMMTSMCVDATVRAAADLGFTVTVIHDACAAPALSFGGIEVPAPSVHAAFLGALAQGYATVVSAAETTGS